VLLVHGWPTSSIDWFEVAEQLSGRFRVCALDFPGYGFSDKPQGWGYSLARDAELLEFYLGDVIGGVQVLHETIQYLGERSENEHGWLTALAGAPFPVTMIWGLRDT